MPVTPVLRRQEDNREFEASLSYTMSYVYTDWHPCFCITQWLYLELSLGCDSSSVSQRNLLAVSRLSTGLS